MELSLIRRARPVSSPAAPSLLAGEGHRSNPLAEASELMLEYVGNASPFSVGFELLFASRRGICLAGELQSRLPSKAWLPRWLACVEVLAAHAMLVAWITSMQSNSGPAANGVELVPDVGGLIAFACEQCIEQVAECVFRETGLFMLPLVVACAAARSLEASQSPHPSSMTLPSRTVKSAAMSAQSLPSDQVTQYDPSVAKSDNSTCIDSPVSSVAVPHPFSPFSRRARISGRNESMVCRMESRTEVGGMVNDR